MGTYNSAVITNGGQSMIAQAVAGASLEFTTIKTSSYAYPAGTNLATLTTISGIKQSKDITSATVYNSRVIKISTAVDNTGISTAYTINTIGIYAKVGSSAESLFAVVTASAADTMPAYDSKPYSYIYEINLTMQNAANVTVTVNTAGLVNVAGLNAAKVEIQGEIANLKSALATETVNLVARNSVSIPANSNLNNYAENGNFRVDTIAIAKTLTNIPEISAGRLVVMQTGSTSNITQFYVTNEGAMYMRSKDDGGWKVWNPMTNTSKTLTNADDLDTLDGPGLYSYGSSSVPQHAPATGNTRLINVQKYGGKELGAAWQLAVVPNGMYYRVHGSNAGAWGDWIFIPKDVSELKSNTYNFAVKNATSVPANADLDDYIAVGNYKVETATIAKTLANVPYTATGGRLMVTQVASSSNIAQIYMTNGSAIYARTKDNSGWKSWVELATNEDIDKLKANTYSLIVNNTSAVPADSDLNNYADAGNYRIETVAVARTLLNAPAWIGGRLIVTQAGSSANIAQIFIANDGSLYMRSKDNSGWSDWKKLSDSGDSVSTKVYEKSIRAIMRHSTYDISFANATEPISMTNYIGNTQNVHPKVLYFANKFGGHRYWMAYTPYPLSNDAYENPCIAYSDDGFSWTNIEGNPLDDPKGNGYNSDTHLVYREDTGTLECWYRYVGPEGQTPREETLYRQTSTNGIDWSAKELVKSNTSGSITEFLSPAVIWDGTKYNMWVVSGSKVKYYASTGADATSLSFVRDYNLTFVDEDDTSVSPWHIDVIKDGATYILLVMCRNGKDIPNKCSLFISTSADNVSYTTPARVVSGNPFGWDKYMYRSSIVKIGDKYRIYYSAGTGGKITIYSNSEWGIGISESDDLAHFIGCSY